MIAASVPTTITAMACIQTAPVGPRLEASANAMTGIARASRDQLNMVDQSGRPRLLNAAFETKSAPVKI